MGGSEAMKAKIGFGIYRLLGTAYERNSSLLSRQISRQFDHPDCRGRLHRLAVQIQQNPNIFSGQLFEHAQQKCAPR